MSDKTILITGATGQQGGAVLRHLVGKGFKLRALTRNPDSDKAKALAAQDVQVIKGDLDDEASLKAALQGAWGVFAVQNTWEAGVEKEEEQGKRIGERPEVIEAAGGHHDQPMHHKYPYVSLAAAADAISASRPGARRESMERYVQRLTALEAVAKSFDGVSEAFAMQAGRELRVLVNSKKVTDEEALLICRQMAEKIEDELTYPGEIRVTLMRETRVTEYAR